ncbi:unnamed protein product [Trichobilharzia regenti]|nr:unnamed protein product [Trichobilharzia regenti]
MENGIFLVAQNSKLPPFWKVMLQCDSFLVNPIASFLSFISTVRYLIGQVQPIWMVISWTAQLLSASIALEICKYWWSWRVTIYHSDRYDIAVDMLNPQNLVNYQPDLNVAVWIGFICEAFGAFVEFYLAILFLCALENWNSQCTRTAIQTTSSSVANSEIPAGSQTSPNCDLSRKQFLASFILRFLINITLVAYGKQYIYIYITLLFIILCPVVTVQLRNLTYVKRFPEKSSEKPATIIDDIPNSEGLNYAEDCGNQKDSNTLDR